MAVAVFIGLSLPSVFAFRKFQAEEPFTNNSVRRLESFSGRDKGKENMRVIAIGSSIMKRAVMFDWKMEDFSGRNGLGGLQFLRLTRPNCQTADILPFFGKILDARPDVILIESDSVFYQRREDDFFKEYPDFLRDMILKSLKARKPVIPKKGYALDIESDLPIKYTDDMLKAALFFIRNRSLMDFGEIEPFFKEAAARGVRVVLVDIPRAPEFERLAAIDRAETAGLLEKLSQGYGVRLIGFPVKLGAEYYWDQTHLKEEGRLKFSLWLVQTLKGMRAAT